MDAEEAYVDFAGGISTLIGRGIHFRRRGRPVVDWHGLPDLDSIHVVGGMEGELKRRGFLVGNSARHCEPDDVLAGGDLPQLVAVRMDRLLLPRSFPGRPWTIGPCATKIFFP